MEGTIMSKGVAIVTGGTRGIGLGIVHGLREAGYDVAATYHGDEEAAKKCEEETGAKCFKFDVANFSACRNPVRKSRRKWEISPFLSTMPGK